MKKVLKVVLYLIVGIALLAGSFALYVHLKGVPTYTPVKADLKIIYTPERVAEGQRLASMLCVKCHLNDNGDALTGKLMKDVPAQFGVAHSANITRDKEFGIEKWTDGQIAVYLRTGVKPNGNYVPPYMPKLPKVSDEDMASIISWLRSDDPILHPKKVKSEPCEPSWFAKFLCHVAFKPLPYPAEPIKQVDQNNLVEFGKYCVQTRYQCFACHSADFATNDELNPHLSKGYCGGGNKMPDYSQKIIPTSNITFDEETGIGKWSLEDFDKALRLAIPPNNQPALRYPMDPYVRLTPIEVKAIYEYLKTIPKIKNKVDRGI